MKTNREKVSYCIGFETATNLKNQFKDVDQSLLMQGLNDGLQGKIPRLGQEEIDQILQNLKKQIEMQQRSYITQLAEENRKSGEQFLEENKAKEGIRVLPSGLQYKVLHEGDGPRPTMLDAVACHYRGNFLNGEIFDSSYEKGKPQSFQLAQVIPGWSEALKMMKVGDRWQLFIPPYLAYGEAGYGPIQPNMTLIFEMELIGIH
ncbi:MAG: FKBP-type peptidyl-prolyl cis-trans isomerase [Chlamydiae bacterium]|nr:FKBP-type peptidyl-prolyl cis-trans isomerase [Chlamydiota bacterium]